MIEKSPQNTNLSDSENLSIDKSKTTNINILLNRVKLDKKKTIKKRLILLSFLVLLISAVTFFSIF